MQILGIVYLFVTGHNPDQQLLHSTMASGVGYSPSLFSIILLPTLITLTTKNETKSIRIAAMNKATPNETLVSRPPPAPL